MLVEIRHFLPGRIRLYIPELFRAEPDPESTLKLLAPDDAIHSIRANKGSSSVVIEYDRNHPNVISDLLALLRRHNAYGLRHLPVQLLGNGNTPGRMLHLRIWRRNNGR